jgi:hypothetical protein
MRDLIPLPEALAPVRARYGELIDAAVRWCHERGEDVDPDLFALLCAGAVSFGEPDDPAIDTAPLVWSRVGVQSLPRCGIPNFATVHEADCPLDVVLAVWVWLDFLHDTRRVDPRSDPLWELRKPLICYGGPGFDGGWRPDNDPPPVPCECFLPYPGSAEYLNDEIPRGRLVEDILVWDPPNRPVGDGGPARVGRRWTSDMDAAGPPRSSTRRAGARRPGRARRPGTRPPGTRPPARPGAPGPGRATGAGGPDAASEAGGPDAATGASGPAAVPDGIPGATPEARRPQPERGGGPAQVRRGDGGRSGRPRG